MKAIKVEDEIDDSNNVSGSMKKVSWIEKSIANNTSVANKKPVGGNVLRTEGRKQIVFNNIVSNEIREESYMGNNHFPRVIAKKCLRQNLKEINLVDVEVDKTFKYAVHTATWKNIPNIYDKYMAQRWYEYAKSKNFYDGDVLVLKMGRFSPYLYATLRKG
ncbi:hypothetical protein KIW84_021520 [Lathyrus oleraceus]|uniref:B3 domain-containing protein n=1 Tax=Pisum sativum TaxID=3888 RepID=A0A9D4Y819_PEA|nr:hypothetical protein KIW84_021520 [Pisum sativum]